MYDWVLITPLEGFVEDAPRKEIAIAPIAEYLKQLLGRSISDKLAVSNTYVAVFLIEGYEKAHYQFREAL